MTIGGSYADGCFRAAEQHNATLESLTTCDRAFTEQALTAEDELATYVNRGILRMMRSDFSRASQDFGTAIAMDPNRSEPYLNMADPADSSRARARTPCPCSQRLSNLGPMYLNLLIMVADWPMRMSAMSGPAYDDLQRAVSLKPKWDAPAKDLARYQVRRR
jgi:hypothetical protein